MFRLSSLISLLLALSAFHSSEAADTCTGSQAISNANRKIAIAIDSSGSMAETDPNNLRISAGRALAGSLLPTDLVTVIDFDDSTRIVCPLGPPSKVSFAGIDSLGGTDIAAGVQVAIDECTQDKNSVVAGVTGVVVLTDGQDFFQDDLVTQLARAKTLGIRVSFGFLSPDDSTATQDPSILSGILATGGVYATISDATAQAAFVQLVLSHGLVNSDTSSASSTLLLPGLLTAGKADSSSGGKTFTYDAVAGEKLNFTITSITTGADFEATLRAKSGSKKALSTGDTKAAGVVSLLYTAPVNGELDLVVRGLDASTGLFSVSLSSSVKRTVTLCRSGNSTTPISPSGTGVSPPSSTGTGTGAGSGSGSGTLSGTGVSPPLATGTGGFQSGNVTVPKIPTPPTPAFSFTGGSSVLESASRYLGIPILLVGFVNMVV